jgi:hypothetical protein
LISVPVLVWYRAKSAWWMLFTQRRAKIDDSGVEWCHGTEIGYYLPALDLDGFVRLEFSIF